jgi:hypothetical protein
VQNEQNYKKKPRTRGYVDDRCATTRLALLGPWTTADGQAVDRLRLTTRLPTGIAHRLPGFHPHTHRPQSAINEIENFKTHALSAAEIV